MARLLELGKTININGEHLQVMAFLGAGAQGEVYEVNYRGRNMALKWYFEHTASPKQQKNLEYLISISSPSPLFLWPEKLIKINGKKSFGYLMPKRSKRYCSIVDLMKRRAEPRFDVLIKAALEMVSSYLILHKKGLCYQDIAFGNLFFDPKTGETLICDNDNVVPEGSASQNVLGTPRFMAPEIVRGEMKPDIKTDLFSLSVLLFYIFMIHHPLEGRLESKIKCFDLPAMTKLYGTNPVFIYDPHNSSNRPVTGLHQNAIAFWQVYPQFFKEAFIKAFTTGLKRDGRITEEEWLKILIKLSHSIYSCRCGAENFYDRSKLKFGNLKCWACKQVTDLPPRMKIGDRVLILEKDKILYDYHLKAHAYIRKARRIARISYQKVDDAWVIENLSSDVWKIHYAGQVTHLANGQRIKLKTAIKIDFVLTNAVIRI